MSVERRVTLRLGTLGARQNSGISRWKAVSELEDWKALRTLLTRETVGSKAWEEGRRFGESNTLTARERMMEKLEDGRTEDKALYVALIQKYEKELRTRAVAGENNIEREACITHLGVLYDDKPQALQEYGDVDRQILEQILKEGGPFRQIRSVFLALRRRLEKGSGFTCAELEQILEGERVVMPSTTHMDPFVRRRGSRLQEEGYRLLLRYFGGKVGVKVKVYSVREYHAVCERGDPDWLIRGEEGTVEARAFRALRSFAGMLESMRAWNRVEASLRTRDPSLREMRGWEVKETMERLFERVRKGVEAKYKRWEEFWRGVRR
ncbi:hypothetical protein HYS50_00530 [Candidatus Woesearchaeota archaeon]|nr:hypothetical protein [Candidatus Woesearchaeota archaeon]